MCNAEKQWHTFVMNRSHTTNPVHEMHKNISTEQILLYYGDQWQEEVKRSTKSATNEYF